MVQQVDSSMPERTGRWAQCGMKAQGPPAAPEGSQPVNCDRPMQDKGVLKGLDFFC